MSDVDFPRTIRHIHNLIIIPPTWWERLLLRFLREQVYDGAIHTIHYKYLFDWLWILRAEPKSAPQQKKAGDLLKGCGYFTPWWN